MSGGQKSRLVLAAALWGKPHIIALVRRRNAACVPPVRAGHI
jgi:hypothetical protein